MTQIVGQEKDDLMHFGVKGMKWGVRKTEAPASRSASAKSAPPRGEMARSSTRSELRAKNKASRARDREVRQVQNKEQFKKSQTEFKSKMASRDKEIVDARNQVGKKADAMKTAKATYKVEKKELGSREARKKLTAARQDFWDNAGKAYKNTSGEDYDAALTDLGYNVIDALLYDR